MIIPHIPLRLFHGSALPDLTSLKIAFAQNDTPLGPGVYLTEDPLVARCYSKDLGKIYEVEVRGNRSYVINLDEPFKKQTFEARSSIIKLLHLAKCEMPSTDKLDARKIIQMTQSKFTKEERNLRLAQLGIWMIFGTLDCYESNGRGDRGIQYVILEDTSIMSVKPYIKQVEPSEV